jgi:ATP-binding cassette subfamily B protein
MAEDLPPALASMWRALKRGYATEPLLIVVAFLMSLLAALPDALLALWLKWAALGIVEGRRALALGAGAGLALSVVATWCLRIVSERTQRYFRERLTIALEAHVARLQATVATVEHHERTEYLDRLSVLRNQIFVLDHMYWSLFATCGWILRLGVTLALLASIHPALMLLALFAVPTVLTSTWRPGVERAAEEAGAARSRLARHLFDLATTAPPGKEVRVTGIGERLVRDRRAAWEGWYGPVARARSESALWHAAGWTLFGLAYVGGVAFVALRPGSTAGDLVLVLAAGARLSAYLGATVGEIGFLRGIWLDGSRRLAWLEDYACSRIREAPLPAPSALGEGIRFEGVSFAYPGTDRLVLEDVSLDLKPGTVVALVGENGAGKTTLVKLLCRLYEPSRGRILVDGVELGRIHPEAWRARLAGAFQDFHKFEFAARRSVGVGDLPRVDSSEAVLGALERAFAADLVPRLASGLDTQLGPTWPGGTDLSFGQWQKLALGRGFMREGPLVLVLDEPTAALDAETEHALFEGYAAAARGGGPNGAGRITLLVSHRFSTVRMADFIVVLDGSRVAESGSHPSLMARRGRYAELYSIQAAAYR